MITTDIRSFTINWTFRLPDVQVSVWLEYAVNEVVMLCIAKNEHIATDGSTTAAELNIMLKVLKSDLRHWSTLEFPFQHKAPRTMILQHNLL